MPPKLSAQELFKRIPPRGVPALIKQAVQTRAPFVLWTPGKRSLLASTILQIGPENRYLVFQNPKGLSSTHFFDHLFRSGSSSCFVNISLQFTSIFFLTHVMAITEAGVRFTFPSEVFQVQRRKDFRFSLTPPYALYAECTRRKTGTHEKLRILDISAGGMALLAPKNSEPPFEADEGFRNIRIIIRNYPIRCQGRICYVARTKGLPAGTKLGVIFEHLSVKDRKLLQEFVLSESRAYFSRSLKS